MPSLRIPASHTSRRRPWLGLGLVLLALMLGAAALALSDSFAVGVVRGVEPVPGTNAYLVEVSPLGLFGEAGASFGSYYVLTHRDARDLRGRWIMAAGQARPISPGAAVLEASTLEHVPLLHGGQLEDAQRLLHNAGLLAASHGLGALALGLCLLLFGFLPLRLASAAILGALWGIVAWHITVLGLAAGWFGASPSVAGTVFFGSLALGSLLGLRRGGVLDELTQRLMLLFVLLTFAPALALHFGWHPAVAMALAIACACLSRLAAVTLFIGFLLGAGLETTTLGSHVALVGAGIAVHFVSGARWLDLLASARAAKRDSGAPARIRLKDMVYA